MVTKRFEKQINSNYTLYLEVTQIAGTNPLTQSKLKFSAKFVGTSGTSAWTSGGCSVDIRFDNATSGSNRYQNSGIWFDMKTQRTCYLTTPDTSAGRGVNTYTTTNQEKTSGDINHNSDGTKTVRCYCVLTSGSSLVGTCTIDENLVLDPTYVAHTVSFSDSYVLINSANIRNNLAVYIDNKGNSLQHALYWKLHRADNYVIYPTGTFSATTLSIPYQGGSGGSPTSLTSKAGTAASGTFYFQLVTFDNDNQPLPTTSEGSVSFTIDLYPTRAHETSRTINGTKYNYNGTYIPIAGYSSLTLSLSGAAASAGIASTSLTTTVSSSVSLSTGNFTGSSGTITTNTFPLSNKGYTVTFSGSTSDVRHSVNFNISSQDVLGYKAPELNSGYKFIRTSNYSGDEPQEDPGGNYIYISYSVKYYGFINSSGAEISGSNTGTATCTCTSGKVYTINSSGQKTSTSVSSLSTNTYYYLSIDDLINITLSASDSLTSNKVLLTTSIASGKFALDLYEEVTNSVRHLGVGLGAIAESDFIKVGLHLKGPWLYTINSAGTNGLNQFDERALYFNPTTPGSPKETGVSTVDCWGVCYTFGRDGGTNSRWYLQKRYTTAGKIYLRYNVNHYDPSSSNWSTWVDQQDVTVTTEDNNNALYLTGVTSGATTTLKRDTSISITGNTFNGEVKFINSGYTSTGTLTDTAGGIACSNKGVRYLVNELLTDGIVAPASNYINNSFNTTGGTIAFYKYTSGSNGSFTGLTKTAYIDTNGKYHPQVSYTDTYYLTGLAGASSDTSSDSTVRLRVQVPIPSGYSTATAALATNTSIGLNYNGTGSSKTITAVTVDHLNPSSVVLFLSMSGLTNHANYTITSGQIKITLS